MFGFNMTDRTSKNTFNNEELRQIMIQKIDQAEQLVKEVKELARQIGLISEKRR